MCKNSTNSRVRIRNSCFFYCICRFRLFKCLFKTNSGQMSANERSQLLTQASSKCSVVSSMDT